MVVVGRAQAPPPWETPPTAEIPPLYPPADPPRTTLPPPPPPRVLIDSWGSGCIRTVGSRPPRGSTRQRTSESRAHVHTGTERPRHPDTQTPRLRCQGFEVTALCMEGTLAVAWVGFCWFAHVLFHVQIWIGIQSFYHSLRVPGVCVTSQ